MLRKAQNSSDSHYAPASRSGWFHGMVGGKLLGFGVAMLIGASIPKLLTVVLLGGVVGGMTGAGQKPKMVVGARRDKRIRAYAFQGVENTPRGLNDNIDEEFNIVSSSSGGGEKDRRAMKAAPKLAVPPPAPPKMGGM